VELLGLKARGSKIASVACIESTREIAGRRETEKRYVIGSLPADSHRFLHAVRTHWGIENGLHGCLDVTFGEDASLIRLRNAAQDFSFLRRIALNLWRADTSRPLGLPRKLKTLLTIPTTSPVPSSCAEFDAPALISGCSSSTIRHIFGRIGGLALAAL
jgi:predicted transposase YbfD/YdcC